MKSSVSVILAAVALSGCISILPEPAPAPRIFALRAGPQAQPPAPERNVVVTVAAPAVPQTLNGGDILWIKDGAPGFMERSVWTSRTPEALQALLVETIDAQNLVLAGLRSGEGARADAELRWEVRDFQIVESGGEISALFSADAKLVDIRTRTVIAALAVREQAPLGERSATRAAAALEAVARAGAEALGRWAAANARGAEEAQPRAASMIR
jgi:ABC-type uncharacterized transport system auxiliary subunit